MGHPWLFEFGALLYGIMTAQDTWRSSCARLAEYVPDGNPGRRARVLDLGCGPGVSTIAIASRRPGMQVIGLDIASRMLTEARHYTVEAGLEQSVEYILADAAHLPFAGGAWDLVTGHSFLYLLKDRTGVLSEAFRVLRSEGRLATMEPSSGPKAIRPLLSHWRNWRYLISIALWRPYSRFLHIQFSDESFRRLLKNAGFQNPRTEWVLDGYGIIGSGDKP